MVFPSLENGPTSLTMIAREFFLDAGAATPIVGMCFHITSVDFPSLVLLC
jgi:hypothetical protein